LVQGKRKGHEKAVDTQLRESWKKKRHWAISTGFSKQTKKKKGEGSVWSGGQVEKTRKKKSEVI